MQTETVTKKKKKSIFKRWWFWVIVVIVIGGIATSGSDTDDTASDSKITSEKKVSSDVETANKVADEEAAVEKTEKEIKAAKAAEPVKVWENTNVVVYFKEANADGVKFLVENKSGRSITVQADNVAVNGFSSNDIMMSDDIAPNSKGYANAETTELADAGDAETVSGSLNIIDTDSMDTIANAQFTNVSVK